MQVFVSDLHLDADTPRATAALGRVLARESMRCDAIYIVGDLVEAWVGDDDDDPFAISLRDLLAAAARRCRVVLMHGNRDFLLGPKFAAMTGVELVAEPRVLSTGLGRALLCHGDAFCTRDTAYLELRAVVRSPSWQADFLAKPIAERRGVAAHLRAESRKATANKPAQIMDVTVDAIAAAAREHDAALVIHGHTHRPAIHAHELGDRIVRRYVLGDWAHCGWLLRLDGASAQLECFALS